MLKKHGKFSITFYRARNQSGGISILIQMKRGTMRTMKYLLFTLFVMTLLTNCSKDDKGNSPEFPLKASDSLDDLDYRLYTLVLEEHFTHSENLVVYQEIQPGSPINDHSFIQYLKAEYPDLDTTVFYDPILASDSVYYLENRFNVASKKVSLVSADEIQYIFSNSDINKGWEEFYRRYPDSPGTISFSRIGYNTNKTQAVVSMGNMYASLGGEGRMIFLTLIYNRWQIAKSVPTWIS